MAYSTSNSNSNSNSNNKTKYHQFQHFNDQLIPGLPHDLALDCLLRLPLTSLPSLRLVSLLWYSTLSHPSFFSLRRHLHLAHHHLLLIQPSTTTTTTSTNHQQNSIILQETTTNTNKDTIFTNNNPLLYNLNLYNTTSNTWHHLNGPTIPAFSQLVVLPTAAKAVVLGGWDPTTLQPISTVLIIDLATGTWKQGSPMPVARSFFAVAVVSAAVYVAGGHDGQKNALKSAAVYDVAADEWSELPSMTEERDESYGMVKNGKFWVVSGYGTNSQGRFRPDCEVFDPVNSGWERVTGLWPYPGKSPKCTAVVTVEGELRWWHVAEEGVLEFDWDEMVWKKVNLGRVNEPVNGLWGSSTSVFLIGIGNGKVLFMGNGPNNNNNNNNDNNNNNNMFILEKEKEDKVEIRKNEKCGVNDNLNWKWKNVEAPSKFLGFPFCANHIHM